MVTAKYSNRATFSEGILAFMFKGCDKDGSPMGKVKFELIAQSFIPPVAWVASGSCFDQGLC